MAKLVPLTQGKYATVSDEDYEHVVFYDWHAMSNYGRWYVGGRPDGKQTYLHRFLMDDPQGLDVDHQDHDGLNNCRWNLRVSTRAENMQARNTWGQYGYKGVTWESRRNK